MRPPRPPNRPRRDEVTRSVAESHNPSKATPQNDASKPEEKNDKNSVSFARDRRPAVNEPASTVDRDLAARNKKQPGPIAVLGSSADEALQIEGRRKERESARTRLLSFRLFKALGLIVIIGLLIWAVVFSPLFAVRDGSVRVQMSGQEVDFSSAVTVAETQVGTPLLRLNTGAVENEILEDTKLQTARVTRSWPGGLDVVVTARLPFLALETQNGDTKYLLYGNDSIPIGGSNEVPEGIPVVTGATELSANQFAQLADIWGSMESSLQDQVERLDIAGTVVTLNLVGGSTVIWGTSNDNALKAEVLQILVEQRPSSAYDISDPTRPTTR